jgi:hypothetical protein
MNIFEREIFDGLAENITSQNTIAICCDIIPSKDSRANLFNENQQIAIACLGGQYQQSDLYYLNSVLVSTGWNKNDDVFTKENLWNARSTPVNKPFNFMHDENDIIGHITGSMVLDQEGNLIPDSSESVPDYFDILTSAVIYKSWADKDQKDRVLNLIEEIDNGSWSVSMECMFSDFDYAVVDKNGGSRVLARTKDSAFLTKHLRAYGGQGEYEGYKLGRLLKGFYFSGKGLVNKPANPRSVIFSKDINPFNKTISNFQTTAMEVNEMTEPNQEQISELQRNLDEINVKLQSVLAEKQVAEQTVADVQSAIAQKDQVIASLEAKVKELTDSVTAAEKMGKEKDMEMDKMKKDMKSMKRKEKLSKAGADDQTAEELIAKFIDVSDEAFDSVVALVSVKAPKEVAKEEIVVEASELNKVEVSEASVQQPSEEEEDKPSKAVAAAVEWIGSVLKTTKKNEVR